MLVHVWFNVCLIRIGLDWIQFAVYALGLFYVLVSLRSVYVCCVFRVRFVYVWFVLGLNLVPVCFLGGLCLLYIQPNVG